MKLVLPYSSGNISVCDLGCGDRKSLLGVLSKTNKSQLVGIDCCIADGISKNIESRYANLDSVPLPMADGEFDLVTMLAVLEHLENYSEIIRECYRGLSNGGMLVLTTPSPASKPILELLADLRVISHASVYDHKKYFKKHEIFDLLEQHGFSDIKIRSVACGLNTVAAATKNIA